MFVSVSPAWIHRQQQRAKEHSATPRKAASHRWFVLRQTQAKINAPVLAILTSKTSAPETRYASPNKQTSSIGLEVASNSELPRKAWANPATATTPVVQNTTTVLGLTFVWDQVATPTVVKPATCRRPNVPPTTTAQNTPKAREPVCEIAKRFETKAKLVDQVTRLIQLTTTARRATCA